MISVIVPGLDDETSVRMSKLCARSYIDMAHVKGEVEIVRINRKGTFAENVNSGLARAGGDVICVVNNDTIGLPEWDEWVRRATGTQKVIASLTRSYAAGAAFAAGRGVWESVGPLDENLRNSYEDVDWFIRAARFGIGRRIADREYVIHESGVTIDRVYGPMDSEVRQRMAHANREYMRKKWPGVNVDAVQEAYWGVHGVEIMREYQTARNRAQALDRA